MSMEAQQAFKFLKERLTSSPVLCMPNPEAQYILEVDTSDTGVGAILFQHVGPDQKVLLTPLERNYDVRDRELLAVKLVLQEWRHWLE